MIVSKKMREIRAVSQQILFMYVIICFLTFKLGVLHNFCYYFLRTVEFPQHVS